MTQSLTPIRPQALSAPRTVSHWARLAVRGRLWIALYVLMLPTILSMLVFGYYPKIDVIIKSFYRWEPGQTEEFIGLKNFLDAAADPLFWQSFKLVAILLAANAVKMAPGIITAIALHRLASNRWRYIFQICFVIPMVIPGLVWLLIWKSFYDPDFGILNRLLNATGLMSLLHVLDGTGGEPGLMPRLAGALAPLLQGVEAIFASVWGLILLGAMVLTQTSWPVTAGGKRRIGQGLTLAIGVASALVVASAQAGHMPAMALCLAAVVAGLVALARVCGSLWLAWAFWMLVGAWACSERIAVLPLLVALAAVLGELLISLLNPLTSRTALRSVGFVLLAIGAALVLLGMVWTAPTGQFEFGSPAWLGNKDLVIPAIIFWGFPWVGTVGVLIYLAGLQQISTDVYEAAELDGVGPVRRLFAIELPLIMTQVRINLIFMTIGTLTTYEFFMILLGTSGGPGNRGMVPGLYMYQQAFIDGRFGYACALGMVMFVLVLLLTVVYQRYVKVEK
jgi:ABC-type sugar transport system permease subunit